MSDGLQLEKDTIRSEGVYCEWISYPPGGFDKNNLLQIENVRGDCTVMRLTVTKEEAAKIADFVDVERDKEWARTQPHTAQ